MAAERGESEHVLLAPAVGAREQVNLGQNALCPRLQLRPEERLDVEERLPTVLTSRTREIHLHVSLRIDFSHFLGERIGHRLGQLFWSNCDTAPRRRRHTTRQ